MKNIYFLLFLSASFFLLAQNPKNIKRKQGFQFNVQVIALAVGHKTDVETMPEELMMNVSESQLFGVNFEAHYRFDEFWIVGLGTGYEYVTQPEISYIPVYLSLRSSIGGDKLEAPIFRLDFGTQLGDLAKLAPLARIGIGYRIPIYQQFCLNLEGIFTYQGLRKEFDFEPGIIRYYNMLGFGIGAGIEL